MTTERLQEFYVLATVLNFSRAAENLFLTQSVLSRHIREMEKELSVTLFTRTTHAVALTEEGKYLYKEAGAILKKTELAATLLSTGAFRAEGKVLIRAHEQTLCTPVLSFIQNFKARYPAIHLSFQMIYAAPELGVIGDADILLSPCDFTDRLPERFLASHLLSQDALLAFPPYHHFGDQSEIALEDLSGETLIVPFMNELFGPYSKNALLAARKSKGRLLRVAADSPMDALLRVELGEGSMLIPHHLKHRVYPHTRTLKVTDPECVFPVYAYHAEKGNEAAGLFYESLTGGL